MSLHNVSYTAFVRVGRVRLSIEEMSKNGKLGLSLPGSWCRPVIRPNPQISLPGSIRVIGWCVDAALHGNPDPRVEDDVDDAVQYYAAVVGDRTPAALQETYVRGGAPLVEYLEAEERLKFSLLPWPDYFGSAPKARGDGMRHIAAKPLKVAAAPELRELIRGPLDTDRLGQPAPEDYFIGGRALIARFLLATRQYPHASARLDTALTELVVEDGRVAGAVVQTPEGRAAKALIEREILPALR